MQQPHPPLYFGGRTKAALRRVARLGDGWFAPALPPGELATAVGDLAAACLAEERQPTELSIAAGSTGGRVDPDEARAYREAGADQIIVPLGGRTLDSCLARLDDLAENLVIPTADL